MVKADYFAHSGHGKPPDGWQLLKDHLEAVAKCTEKSAAKFGAGDFGLAAGLLHDIGKYSEEFQRKLNEVDLGGSFDGWSAYRGAGQAALRANGKPADLLCSCRPPCRSCKWFRHGHSVLCAGQSERTTAMQWADYYAAVYRVPPDLVHAIIEVESAWQPRAISNKGAAGLMQLMPATAVTFGVTNRFEIEQNIRGGVAYLARLLKRVRRRPAPGDGGVRGR